MTTKAIADYEVIDHGPEYSDYFQGCGVCLTQFEDVATGIGQSRADAYEDALESLAQNGWDTESIGPATDHFGKDAQIGDDSGEDCYWHVSVRVK